jgi:hypothetical protein
LTLRDRLFVHKGIISAVTRVKFISDRLVYVKLRGHGCDTVLNVHAPTEDRSDDKKDRFYEEKERVFSKCSAYLTDCTLHKILLGQQNKMRWVGHVARAGEMIHDMDTEVWSGNLKGTEHFGDRARGWEYNIKTNLKETGCEYVEWTQAAQNGAQWRIAVNTVMKFRVE